MIFTVISMRGTDTDGDQFFCIRYISKSKEIVLKIVNYSLVDSTM